MTLQEFNDEFRFKYDAASNGAPDLNSYEKSICLTQGAKDVIEEAYSSYEFNEVSRRILAPLLKEFDSVISPDTDSFTDFDCFLATLPEDLHYIVREEVKLKNCITNAKIENVKLDHLTEKLNNPFKRPNNRKVIRVEHTKTSLKVYSEIELEKYRIKYIKRHKPIILTDFTTDPDLIGDETIMGLSAPTNTELPDFVHDEIIQRAVVWAIKTARENDLRSQIQVK